MQSRSVYSPPDVKNHRKPVTAITRKSQADYGQKPKAKRRGRRQFGTPR